MVFDNAEDIDLLLQYWPLASRGSVIATTRDHTLAFEPAQSGIEIESFETQTGSAFLLHLLSTDTIQELSSKEVESANDLSRKLSDHAPAISQMAGLVRRRSWSIEEFMIIYEQNAQSLHKFSKSSNSLDTVWQLSFQSLDIPTSTLLGILAFLVPDSIPQSLFEIGATKLSKALKFYADRLEYVLRSSTFIHADLE